MRRMVLALGVVVVVGGCVGSGSGGGGGDVDDGGGDDAAPEAVCTTTADAYDRADRTESPMDERGRPRSTTTWDRQGLASRATYTYDDAGRLVEQRLDARSGTAEPDGEPDTIVSIAYAGTTAEVTTTDLRKGESGLTATYSFDDAGRPVRVVKHFLLTDEDRAFQYGGDGHVRVADERGLWDLPHTRYTEYVYGAGGWPSSMRAVVDGDPYDWVFEHQEEPGRVRVNATLKDLQSFTYAYVYDRDGAGRLTRAARAPYPDRDLEITYAEDGAISVRVGGHLLRTYSAACGVTFEVPRGLPTPGGPELLGHHLLPEVPTSYVMPSLKPF